MDGGRLYIDQHGDLHFAYTLLEDATTDPTLFYRCGISTQSDTIITLGNNNYLRVEKVANPVPIKPQLQYSNSGVKGLRFSNVKLECVFSGYDLHPPHVPVIQWHFDNGTEITGTSGKYIVSDDGRAITINNLQESDEKTYYCRAKNSAGFSGKIAVLLDVTSGPIFLPDGAPKDQTVVENVDVTFHCDTRSASQEIAPNSTIWYINGVKMGQRNDPTKYKLSEGNRSLTFTKVKKALCVQCEVQNHVDTIWADACLNVIYGISRLESFDATNTKVFSHEAMHTVIDTKVTSPISHVSIRATDNNIVTLCEVELYGDSACEPDRYGFECEHTCHCAGGEACFVSTGRCPSGCADGFSGETCDQPCRLGYYGPGCGNKCSEHCAKITSGKTFCEQAIINPRSKMTVGVSAKLGYYGPGCGNKCGEHCTKITSGKTFCEHVNGTCLYECESGYTGPTCSTPSSNPSNPWTIGDKMGAVLGTVLIGVLILLVLVIVVRKRNIKLESMEVIAMTTALQTDYVNNMQVSETPHISEYENDNLEHFDVKPPSSDYVSSSVDHVYEEIEEQTFEKQVFPRPLLIHKTSTSQSLLSIIQSQQSG